MTNDFDAADAAFKKRDEHATWGGVEDRDAAVRWHWRGFQDGAGSARRTVQAERDRYRAAIEEARNHEWSSFGDSNTYRILTAALDDTKEGGNRG